MRTLGLLFAIAVSGCQAAARPTAVEAPRANPRVHAVSLFAPPAVTVEPATSTPVVDAVPVAAPVAMAAPAAPTAAPAPGAVSMPPAPPKATVEAPAAAVATTTAPSAPITTIQPTPAALGSVEGPSPPPERSVSPAPVSTVADVPVLPVVQASPAMPAPIYHIADGELIRVALTRWASAEGYELFWSARYDIPVLRGGTLESKDLQTAITDTLRPFWGTRYALRAVEKPGHLILIQPVTPTP